MKPTMGVVVPATKGGYTEAELSATRAELAALQRLERAVRARNTCRSCDEGSACVYHDGQVDQALAELDRLRR